MVDIHMENDSKLQIWKNGNSTPFNYLRYESDLFERWPNNFHSFILLFCFGIDEDKKTIVNWKLKWLDLIFVIYVIDSSYFSFSLNSIVFVIKKFVELNTWVFANCIENVRLPFWTTNLQFWYVYLTFSSFFSLNIWW